MGLILPKEYNNLLGVRETERAIKLTRELFEKKLCEKLNLERVSAPLFVLDGQGINDDLNGVERSVSFDIPALGKDATAQIVHSLAKWKRLTLGEYKCFNVGDGIYTNMNAIRRDEELDNLHSVYVDQWDWERIIAKEDRNEKYLKETVRNIVDTVYEVSEELNKTYPVLKNKISKEITFITSEDLLQMYPGMTAKEREAAITKEKKTVFVMKIGDKLSDGTKHDGRAPDYDDWALNGDILFWHDVLDCPLELSSMGIRVSPESLREQLKKSGHEERETLYYHKKLLNGELPYTIGGGIGQSRLCMLLLQKAHIGEVHASVWPKDMMKKCQEKGMFFL